ncbi:GNAT family N-acetyltransferase [Thermoleophilia bacterium SCSIO 60948]|nr:GNAT family N-acetyltransferase [Thermoleophilia bacterium SCSIO 60948]
MASPVERVRSAIARRGAGGVARSAWERAVKQREFVWYALKLADVESRPLPDGYRLEEVGADGVSVLEKQESIPVAEAREWMTDHGGRLFIVFDDEDDPAFSCFILPNSQPLDPAPNGVVEFPEGMVCLERSFTAAHHRGRGIPAPAWNQIFDRLKGEGDRIVVTKVEVSNRASRRAVDKAGFHEVGLMRVRGDEPGSRLKSIDFDLTGTGIDEREMFDRLAKNLGG